MIVASDVNSVTQQSTRIYILLYYDCCFRCKQCNTIVLQEYISLLPIMIVASDRKQCNTIVYKNISFRFKHWSFRVKCNCLLLFILEVCDEYHPTTFANNFPKTTLIANHSVYHPVYINSLILDIVQRIHFQNLNYVN